jgi:hypothetical protein
VGSVGLRQQRRAANASHGKTLTLSSTARLTCALFGADPHRIIHQ